MKLKVIDGEYNSRDYILVEVDALVFGTRKQFTCNKEVVLRTISTIEGRIKRDTEELEFNKALLEQIERSTAKVKIMETVEEAAKISTEIIEQPL